MIKLECSGSFDKTLSFLKRASEDHIQKVLNKYGKEGVRVLSAATPNRTGRTASSWTFETERKGNTYIIYWNNTNVNKGVNIALILQLGHGTRTGGYVRGLDYINPAMRPIFTKIADEVWKEVTK